MQTNVKRYNILLRGKVQHIGYRGIIEGTARKLDVKGYVFNDIEKKEIHDELYLPSIFSRVATDDYYEFGKKFDIGLDYLDGIKTDTGEMKGTLGEMKGTLGEMKESLTNINTTLEVFVTKQDGHNQRLEKILEKLAER